MPIYEYECGDCGHRMEAIQKLSDPLLVDCPSCGKPGLRKLISAAGFRLSGGGWYETDFKKDKQRNVVNKDKEAPPSADSKKPAGKACAGD